MSRESRSDEVAWARMHTVLPRTQFCFQCIIWSHINVNYIVAIQWPYRTQFIKGGEAVSSGNLPANCFSRLMNLIKKSSRNYPSFQRLPFDKFYFSLKVDHWSSSYLVVISSTKSIDEIATNTVIKGIKCCWRAPLANIQTNWVLNIKLTSS